MTNIQFLSTLRYVSWNTAVEAKRLIMSNGTRQDHSHWSSTYAYGRMPRLLIQLTLCHGTRHELPIPDAEENNMLSFYFQSNSVTPIVSI